MPKRETIPQDIRIQVLTEAGFRCAVPTCRNILALDLHHIVEVAENGGNEPSNLLVLCPTCHALYTRRTIPQESIRAWKMMIVSLNNAFDSQTIDDLLFLSKIGPKQLGISGDGVLKFSRLIGSGLARFYLMVQNGPLLLYDVVLTDKGQDIVSSWKDGDWDRLKEALAENNED